MNSNNNNSITPKKTLELINRAFEIIFNKNKYHMIKDKKDIDLNTIKSLYNGFYAGFKLLIKLPDLPSDIKYQLIAKKNMVDLQYSRNITYPENNMLKISKRAANQTLKINEYLNKKAKNLTNLQALELKAKVTELNNSEKNNLRILQLKTNSNLAKLAANMEYLTLKNNQLSTIFSPQSA